MTEPAGPARALLLALAAVLLSAPLVFLVPPGEAPDEPAHVAYVHHLAAKGTLPRSEDAAGPFSYELYQPPLAYAAMAAAVRACGFEGVDYPFTPDPGFVFQRGASAFKTPPPSARAAEARRALFVARSVNLAWLLLASLATFLTCRQLTSSPWVALAAAAPFALAPQWLFLSAMVSNDAAVSALVAGATLALVRLVSRPSRPLVPLAASTAAGLAVWTKASALAIAPALALALLWLIGSRRWRDAARLLVPGLLLSAGWALLELSRTGSLIPRPQTGWGGGLGFAHLVNHPGWLVSVWGGFWAKLGWFNVPLPPPVYLVFVPPTLAALFGAAAVCRRAMASRAGLLLLVIVAANLSLLFLFMARVDWQPQGRYLLPASAAMAGLATIGVDRLCAAWSERARKRLALLSCALAAATALTMLAVVVVTYGG